MNQTKKRGTVYKNISDNNRNSFESKLLIQYPAYILTCYFPVNKPVDNCSVETPLRISLS